MRRNQCLDLFPLFGMAQACLGQELKSFVPTKDVIKLDMSVEQAAKLVISAGLVVPEHKDDPNNNIEAASVPEITEEAARKLIKSHGRKKEKV